MPAAAGPRAGRLRAVIADPGGTLRDPGPTRKPLGHPDLLIRPFIPQLHLLQRAEAVICHSGHNTVVESLWHGVPLVVAPIRDDQLVIASQVTAAGAGVRVRFGRAGRERIGAALDAVLAEPSYRMAARRIGASFRAGGGAAAAATHLERLASTGHP